MSILSDFEDRVGNVVEGGFARVFRSPVQPAELARKLAREMDRRKVVGVGKVYAPTLYNVLLSPSDDAQLGGFAETLAGELETYLVSDARERSYALATRPVVRFIVDDDLKLGRFDVIGELLSPEEMAAELNEELADLVVGRRTRRLRQRGARADPRPPCPPVPVVKPGLLFDAEAEQASAAFQAVSGAVEPPPRDHHDPRPRPRRRPARRPHGRRPTRLLRHLPRRREHLAAARRVRHATAPAGRSRTSARPTARSSTASASTPLRLRDGDVIVVGITELIYHEPRG